MCLRFRPRSWPFLHELEKSFSEVDIYPVEAPTSRSGREPEEKSRVTNRVALKRYKDDQSGILLTG